MIDIKRWLQLIVLKLRNEATLEQLDELAKINNIVRNADVNGLPKVK